MSEIRVLQVVTKMDVGGIENYIMNNYRNIDRNKIQFDFLTHRSDKGFFDDEIKAMGGRIFHVPPINPLHHKSYINALDEFFKEHQQYNIVHSHINTFSMYALREAQKNGVPVRIAHSHATTSGLDLKTPFRLYTKNRITRYTTDCFACSDDAGRWLFGETPFTVFQNGIDVEKFRYNEQIREKKRYELGWQNNLIIGCVANLLPIKNHSFLIDVFAKLKKQRADAKLLLIGDGAQRADIEAKIKALGLFDDVRLLGVRNDASDYYQAMDEFMLCSFTEGLGIAVVEAQSSGLPCVLSKGVPTAVGVCKNVEFLPVDEPDSNEKWANKALEFSTAKRNTDIEAIFENGFDIHQSVKKLEEFYLEKSK